MTTNDAKAKITARIWQSIAQSGVPISTLPKEQLDALVNAVADGVLVALDDMLADVGLPQRPSTVGGRMVTPEQEIILWSGRPLFSLMEHYQVTTERLIVKKGLFSRDYEDIELVRVQDVDYKQTLGERILDIGDIIIRSSDPSNPVITLRNVTNPGKVHEVIRRATQAARQKYRFSFQEEMTSIRPGQ